MIRSKKYGRLLDDFAPGDVYVHPWEVTVDDGMVAMFAASFQDATPTYASRLAARRLGFRDRPIHPLLLLNLGLSFSVHDVSEQAIAHLAYLSVRFPAACYVGDTVTATSRVLGVKAVSSGDKGVVHVRTELADQDGTVVCTFERKALVRAGRVVSLGPQAAPNPTSLREVSGRPKDPPSEAVDTGNAERARLPAELSAELPPRPTRGGFATFWEDLEVGDVFVHDIGRTVSEAEPMQLSTLFRNSHPLHVDERYCKQNSFVKTRVVYGGLVLSWLIALSSRDTAGNAIWDLGLDEGAHPSGVLAGDTLFGVTQVESKEPHGPRAGAVTLRIVGVKNTHPRALLEAGADLFTPELGKTEGKVKEKVVEFTRTLLLWRRSPAC